MKKFANSIRDESAIKSKLARVLSEYYAIWKFVLFIGGGGDPDAENDPGSGHKTLFYGDGSLDMATITARINFMKTDIDSLNITDKGFNGGGSTSFMLGSMTHFLSHACNRIVRKPSEVVS